MGCQAYDKNESSRGYHQKYGFDLAAGNRYVQITGITRDNFLGGPYEGNGVQQSSIDVLGCDAGSCP